MLTIEAFESYVAQTFDKDKLEAVKGQGEYGFTHIGAREIVRVGYCTNLNIETAKEAVQNKIDLLLTHHDAWPFMSGMAEACQELLKSGNVSHYYIHLPLDDALFGNNTTLLQKLGFEVKTPFALEKGFYCGYIGECSEAIEMTELVERLESLLEEAILHWPFGKKEIKRLAVLTGAGFSTKAIDEALKLGCDAYLTGEKLLYTVAYADFREVNLLVGSHTFTELFGLEHFTAMMKTRYPSLAIIPIKERHLEASAYAK